MVSIIALSSDRHCDDIFNIEIKNNDDINILI